MTEHPKDENDHEDRRPEPTRTRGRQHQRPADDESAGEEPTGEVSAGEVSEGPNSLSGSEADLGGADAVPDKTTGPGTSNQQR